METPVLWIPSQREIDEYLAAEKKRVMAKIWAPLIKAHRLRVSSSR
jgi:hypothetical protein